MQICPTATTLISMVKLCNDRYHIITNKDQIIVYRKQKPIMKVIYCKRTEIYVVNLINPLQSQYEMENSKMTAVISTAHGKENKVINIHYFKL